MKYSTTGTAVAPGPVVPVPASANDCGLPTPLLATLTWPTRTPATTGVNWSVTEQLAPEGKDTPAMHDVATTVNSSGLLLDAGAERVVMALPTLVITRVTVALPTPTGTGPKSTAAGIASCRVRPPGNVCR